MVYSYALKPKSKLRWSPPPLECFKLNFDGIAAGNLSLTGVGGIIPDGESVIFLSFLAPGSCW